MSWAACSVVKLDYSRNPWRIVSENGVEVYHYVPFEHPEPGIGLTTISAPMCYRTKRDAIAALEAERTKERAS
jgi:hypothetical protein